MARPGGTNSVNNGTIAVYETRSLTVAIPGNHQHDTQSDVFQPRGQNI